MSKGLPFSAVTGVGEDDDDSEGGEDKAGTFCGSVLLDSVEFDMNGVLANLQTEWGIMSDRNLKDGFDEEMKTVGSTRVFYYGETVVAITLVPDKIPNNEAEYFAEANYLWPEAVSYTHLSKI